VLFRSLAKARGEGRDPGTGIVITDEPAHLEEKIGELTQKALRQLDTPEGLKEIGKTLTEVRDHAQELGKRVAIVKGDVKPSQELAAASQELESIAKQPEDKRDAKAFQKAQERYKKAEQAVQEQVKTLTPDLTTTAGGKETVEDAFRETLRELQFETPKIKDDAARGKRQLELQKRMQEILRFMGPIEKAAGFEAAMKMPFTPEKLMVQARSEKLFDIGRLLADAGLPVGLDKMLFGTETTDAAGAKVRKPGLLDHLTQKLTGAGVRDTAMGKLGEIQNWFKEETEKAAKIQTVHLDESSIKNLKTDRLKLDGEVTLIDNRRAKLDLGGKTGVDVG
jgi:hypothetical protein